MNVKALIVLFLLQHSLAWALAWKHESLQVDIDAGSDPVLVEFPFKNESSGTVVIKKLKSSCGCSTPQVDETVIPAGKSGVVSVVYDPGDQVGMRVVQVTVETDEPGDKPSSMALKVNIRPAIDFQPRLVRWTQGTEASTQSITVKRVIDTATITSVKSLDDSLEVQLSAYDEESKSWTLRLRPKSMDTARTSTIEIRAAVEGREIAYVVFGIVR